MRTDPTVAQMNAVAKLSQFLGQKYSLDISQKSVFHGKESFNLLGHRDVSATACPGDNFYKTLTYLRRSTTLDQIFITPPSSTPPPVTGTQYSAVLSGKAQVINMQGLEKRTIRLSFLNNGSIAWNQKTWLYAHENTNSALKAESLIYDKNYVVSLINDNQVLPGQTGHFDITLHAGIEPGTHMINVIPIINGERKLNAAQVDIVVQIHHSILAHEIVTPLPAKDTIFLGQKKSYEVSLKNTGNVPWHRSGDMGILLKNKQGKTPLADLQTPDILGYLENDIVQPGGIGVFHVEVFGAFDSGKQHSIELVPVIGADAMFIGNSTTMTITLQEPQHRVQIFIDAQERKVSPGEKKTIDFGLRNIGNADWQENQIALRVLKMNGVRFSDILFYFPEKTLVGETTKTPVTFQAPIVPGEYTVHFQILANNRPLQSTPFYEMVLHVGEAKTQARAVYISKNPIELGYKKRDTLTIRYRNTGETTWYKDGLSATKLFVEKDGTFVRSKDRVIALLTEDIPPNKTAEFIIPLESLSQKNEIVRISLENMFLGTIEGSLFQLEKKDPEQHLLPSSPSVPLTNNQDTNTSKQPVRDLQYFLQRIRNEREILLNRMKEQLQQARENIQISPSPSSSPAITNTLPNTPTNTLPSTSSSRKQENIRVKLSFSEKQAMVYALNADTLTLTIDGEKRENVRGPVFISPYQQGVLVEYDGLSRTARTVIVESAILEIRNWKRSPAWNPSIFDNTFRTALEFSNENNDLLVVNNLSFEDYLSGVAEVPEDEPQEKKKVMAIIARSYALHYTQSSYRKFPGKTYDASDDPNVFQKYLGYGFESRAPQWKKALKDTENIVVMYNNEILRTAYFSCSDGKTKTPEQARWSTEYYRSVASVFQSKDDTQGKDEIRHKLGVCGHGVGLSGLGAKNMAISGKNYREILEYYYSGIELRLY